MEIGGAYVHYIDDCGENADGYYCEVYSDEDMEDRIDFFCISPEYCDCNNIDAVEKYIFDYVSDYEFSGMEVCEMKNIPIYDKTVAYAIEHNEIEAYRASYKANMECRAAVSEAINRNYKDNSLDTKTALKQLTDTFSLERIAVITAVSVRQHDTDGRISAENKEWAKSVPFPKDTDDWGVDRNAVFSVEGTHTGLINLFASTVRKELEATKTVPIKKPSLIEKLNRPLPHSTDKSDKMKGQEL